MDREGAQRLLDAVLGEFRAEGSMLREYAPPHPDDRRSCYLWSYFATTGMLSAMHAAGVEVSAVHRELIDGLAYYRSGESGATVARYHSERGDRPDGGHGPVFFDDNIWVARNLLLAHQVWGDPELVAEAVRIVRFVNGAWDDDLGGVVWNEAGLTPEGTEQELERGLSANACGIIVNAALFAQTGEPDYLRWARRYHAFCTLMQDPHSGVYYNGIRTTVDEGGRVAGEVNRDLYSYNSGSMILADLALYDITGDHDYLADARRAARAAHEAFVRVDEASGLAWYQDFVWFTAVLAEGFLDLARRGDEFARDALQVLADSLDFAVSRYRADSGLVPHDYLAGWRQRDGDEYDRMLLTHAGTAEIAALVLQAHVA